ncbi:MAG: amino acid permease [Candidatus Woesearchaeota archaeon]|nr:amino acid permease [Candidatus Woesearchaeota archaeon]
MSKIEVIEALSTVIGCIIGAGIFGIPYVVARAGFLTGLLGLIFIGLSVMLLYLYLGEVVLRTRGKHQMTGYAEIYLGKWGKRVMLFSMLIGLYGALIAYFIGEGESISSLLGGNPKYYMVGFFFLVSSLLYMGLKALEESESISMFFVLVVVAILAIFSFPHIKTENLVSFDITKFFIPYGVILFAYTGAISIPEANEILTKEKRKLKKVIIMGLLIPMVVYIVFSVIVVGSIGLDGFLSLEPNKRIATIALGEVISPKLFFIANILAILTMFTSFMAVGFALQEMFIYDYNMPKKVAWALTCFIPLFIALSGFTNFIQALDISGTIAGGISCILIILMFHKAKRIGERKPEYEIKSNKAISIALLMLFIVGIVFLFMHSTP